jgi:hypothetical protein
MSDDNDELYDALLEMLFWLFWPKNFWQWLIYIALFGLLSYLKSR